MTPNEKIDFVITWVDGNDEKWQKEKNKYLNDFLNSSVQSTKVNYSKNRYRDWGTLKYWFRGVEKYAPWVNKIYFVTCGQIPSWLNTKNEKLVIMNHDMYMPKKYLPTFNSEAIEINFHRIKDLSENFVYFNDDLFILNKVEPSDFFKNGLPCDSAVLGIVPMVSDAGYTDFNNTRILNKYFHKKEVIKNNFSKWFSLKYGKDIFKTLLLLPFNHFTGMTEYHLCNSLKKSTFEKIWELEPDVMENTSMNKFRANNDVNLWLLKNWNMLEGNFIPRNPKIGKSYISKINKNICNEIISGTYKIMCINDPVDLSDEDFIKEKNKLINAFEEAFPDKSSFERVD